jgi:hypothetical protein
VKPSAVAVGLPKVGVRAAAAAITNENEDVVAEVVLLSRNVAVIGKVPLRVGVPEITPVLVFRFKPAGRVPVTE